MELEGEKTGVSPIQPFNFNPTGGPKFPTQPQGRRPSWVGSITLPHTHKLRTTRELTPFRWFRGTNSSHPIGGGPLL